MNQQDVASYRLLTEYTNQYIEPSKIYYGLSEFNQTSSGGSNVIQKDYIVDSRFYRQRLNGGAHANDQVNNEKVNPLSAARDIALHSWKTRQTLDEGTLLGYISGVTALYMPMEVDHFTVTINSITTRINCRVPDDNVDIADLLEEQKKYDSLLSSNVETHLIQDEVKCAHTVTDKLTWSFLPSEPVVMDGVEYKRVRFALPFIPGFLIDNGMELQLSNTCNDCPYFVEFITFNMYTYQFLSSFSLIELWESMGSDATLKPECDSEGQSPFVFRLLGTNPTWFRCWPNSIEFIQEPISKDDRSYHLFENEILLASKIKTL